MLSKLYQKITFSLQKLVRLIKSRASSMQRDYQFGNQLLAQNHFEEAYELFRKHIKKFPKSEHGYEGLAVIDLKTYQWESAIKWLDKSIEKTKAESSYQRKANLLINHAQFDEGFEVIEEMIRVHGKNRSGMLFKAEQLFKPKRFSEAIDILYGIKQNLTSQIKLARALIGDNKYKEADEVINNLLLQRENAKKDEEKMLDLLECWQKYYLAGVDFKKPKIFGIGLSRTATTSLTTALNILGFTTIHFINPLTNQIINNEDFLYFDAFCDSPISYRFEELYELFPNARFIYTKRNLADWVRSSSNLYKPRGFSTTTELKVWLNNEDGNKFDKLYHNYDPVYQKSYGSLYADFVDWETAYLAFDKRVNNFFADKPNSKLLKINICSDPKWDKLCNFLNVPIPAMPFPYSNTVITRDKTKGE